MKIEKTPGVKTADHATCIRIQEIIMGYKEQCPYIGKVVIDAEKITYYKFRLALAVSRLSVNGIIYNDGRLSCATIFTPVVYDESLCIELFKLFGLSNPFGNKR